MRLGGTYRNPAKSRRQRPKPCGGAPTHADGFTLLEVLVALAILGLSLSVLLAVFSQSLRQSRESERQFAARNLAQSLMDQTQALPPEKLVDASGETSQGLRWRIDLSDYGRDADRNAWSARPVKILIEIRWRGYARPQRYTLTSLRLLPRKP